MTYYTQTVAGCFVAEPRGQLLDNPNISLTDPRLWEEYFGGGTADSGITINPRTALTYAPVWQAVSLISSDVARLPLMVYRRRWQGDLEYFDAQPDHPITYKCAVSPNDEETAVDFWARVMVHALMWNNAYIYTDLSGEMFTLLPDRTTPERTRSGEKYFVSEVDGKLTAIVAEQIMHIKGPSFTAMADCELVSLARNSWALGLAHEKFQSKFFANGGRIGGILELPLGMPKPARDQIEEGFRKSYEGADNPFKTVVLRDNAKFHAAQQSPEDAQLVESSEQQVRQVARWFNIPPAKLGLKDATAYNAQEQTNQAYLDQCLAIWLRRIQAQVMLRKFSAREQALYTVRHVLTDLLKMDPKKHAETSEILIRCKVKNPNEVRSELNMLPYDGGDEFSEAATPAQPVVSDPVDDKSPDDEPMDPPDSEDDSVRLTRRRVLFGLTARARHKAKNPAAFIQWLDGSWPDHREQWTAATNGAAEPEFFAGLHDQLQQVASTATPAELYASVDTVATNFERNA